MATLATLETTIHHAVTQAMSLQKILCKDCNRTEGIGCQLVGDGGGAGAPTVAGVAIGDVPTHHVDYYIPPFLSSSCWDSHSGGSALVFCDFLTHPLRVIVARTVESFLLLQCELSPRLLGWLERRVPHHTGCTDLALAGACELALRRGDSSNHDLLDPIEPTKSWEVVH